MICVLATITVSAGKRDEFLAVFEELVPKVLAEDGCIEYGPWLDLTTNIDIQEAERKNTVVLVEKWESIEALEAHLIAPHMIAFRKATESMRLKIALQILQPA